MALIIPEYLQTKKYRAIRDRLTLAHGGAVQAGVWAAGDFKVTQRASGANMSTDVAAGFALVNANDPGNLGLYHIQNDATINVPFIATEGNPRIDQVVLTVNDSADGGDPSDTPVLQVIKGTAISGVTLDAPGASKGAVPNGSLVLADVLVPANSDATGIITANIRDRRPWARGAFAKISIANRGSDYVTSSGTPVPLDVTNLEPRLEFSGALVRISLHGRLSFTVNGDQVRFAPRLDGSTWSDPQFGNNPVLDISADSGNVWKALAPLQAPMGGIAPGSHTIGWNWQRTVGSGSVILKSTSVSDHVHVIIEEVIRQSATNT